MGKHIMQCFRHATYHTWFWYGVYRRTLFSSGPASLSCLDLTPLKQEIFSSGKIKRQCWLGVYHDGLIKGIIWRFVLILRFLLFIIHWCGFPYNFQTFRTAQYYWLLYFYKVSISICLKKAIKTDIITTRDTHTQPVVKVSHYCTLITRLKRDQGEKNKIHCSFT